MIQQTFSIRIADEINNKEKDHHCTRCMNTIYKVRKMNLSLFENLVFLEN